MSELSGGGACAAAIAGEHNASAVSRIGIRMRIAGSLDQETAREELTTRIANLEEGAACRNRGTTGCANTSTSSARTDRICINLWLTE